MVQCERQSFNNRVTQLFFSSSFKHFHFCEPIPNYKYLHGKQRKKINKLNAQKFSKLSHYCFGIAIEKYLRPHYSFTCGFNIHEKPFYYRIHKHFNRMVT